MANNYGLDYVSPYSVAYQGNYDHGLTPSPYSSVRSSLYPNSQIQSGQPSNSSSPSISPSSITKLTPVKNAIDTFGTNFGLAGPNQVYNAAVGPTATGAPMSAGSAGASLSGVLGGAGIGAGVGGLTTMLTGGNQVGASLGGGIGGGIAAGAGFGPVGMAVGGVMGGLVGGLFGNKKPSDKTQAGGVNLFTGQANRNYADKESQTGKKFSSQMAQLRDQTEAGVSRFSQFLLQNGAKPMDDGKGERELVLVLGNRDGFRYFARPTSRVDDSPMQNFGKDYKGYSNALVNEVMSRYQVPDQLRNQVQEMIKAGKFDDIRAFGQDTKAASGMQFGAQPMIPGARPNGAESYADFIKRHRATGATSPIRAKK